MLSDYGPIGLIRPTSRVAFSTHSFLKLAPAINFKWRRNATCYTTRFQFQPVPKRTVHPVRTLQFFSKYNDHVYYKTRNS